MHIGIIYMNINAYSSERIYMGGIGSIYVCIGMCIFSNIKRIAKQVRKASRF